ncbi:MAG: hypothetical protein PHV68_02165 [Candidatus Gastranaerophilales bacterium]|nr:hypothetical protein [Candidatus Gastranaerophilales bacterium]
MNAVGALGPMTGLFGQKMKAPEKNETTGSLADASKEIKKKNEAPLFPPVEKTGEIANKMESPFETTGSLASAGSAAGALDFAA